MSNKEFDIAKKNLDFLDEEIKSVKLPLDKRVKKVVKTILSNRPDKNSIVLGDTTLSWDIDVLGNEGKIIIDNRVDEVTNLYIEIEGEPFTLLENGKLGDYNVTFGATLKF